MTPCRRLACALALIALLTTACSGEVDRDPAAGGGTIGTGSGGLSSLPLEPNPDAGVVTPVPTQPPDPTPPQPSAAKTSGTGGRLGSDSPFLFALLEQNIVARTTPALATSQDDLQHYGVLEVSEVVGAISQILPMESGYVLTSTNHHDLVFLDDRLKVLRTVNATSELGLSGNLRIGTIVAHQQDASIVVPVADGAEIILWKVDVRTGATVAQVTYADRFAGYAPMCVLDSGMIALSSTDFVDLIDGASLQRRRVLRQVDNRTQSQLACSADRVFIADGASPRVDEVDESGVTQRQHRWTGMDATDLTLLRNGDLVVIDGQQSQVVFCADTCAPGVRVGRKPNGAAELADGTVVVSSELGQGLTFFDAVGRQSATAGTPASPRAPSAS